MNVYYILSDEDYGIEYDMQDWMFAMSLSQFKCDFIFIYRQHSIIIRSLIRAKQ